MVTASDDNTAKIVDAVTGHVIATITHNGWVTSATFSPDGSKVVTASGDNTAKIVDAVTGYVIATITHNNWVNSATFSPDSSKVVTADNTAKIWPLNLANVSDDQTIAIIQS